MEWRVLEVPEGEEGAEGEGGEGKEREVGEGEKREREHESDGEESTDVDGATAVKGKMAMARKVQATDSATNQLKSLLIGHPNSIESCY